jgi:transposase InsO family protein
MVPTQAGMWCSWLPCALPQCWPFCWWLAFVLDHHSRRIMGFAVFLRPPSSTAVRAFLDRVIHAAGTAPKYLISDKGCQLWCAAFKRWCQRRNIKLRFGAIGKHGSIAVLERAIRTLKELLPKAARIPYRHAEMRQLVRLLIGWYNEHRPHTTLKGATPDEIYFKRFPANRKPRIELRPRWPRGSPCARPYALVGGNPGARFNIEVERVDGQPQLPVIRLRRAA